MRVLVFGTFDDFHPGHRFFLRRAGRRGVLFIVVARDATVRRLKKRSPLHNESERRAVLTRAFPKAHVRLGHPSNFLMPVRDVQPDRIFLGYDQSLPPGVRRADLPCPVRRLPAFKPHVHKSSLRRTRKM